MSKIKIRFSYFLMIGIVGFILQLISFFCFNDTSITSSNLVASSNAKFNAFIGNSIVLLFSCICIAGMFVGYLLGKKKDKELFFNVGAWGVIATQALIFIVTLVYLIFATVVRKDMFKVDSNKNMIATLVNIRFVLVILSYAVMSLFALNLPKVKNMNKTSNITTKVLLGVNVIAFVLFVVVAFTSFINDAHSMLTNLYELKHLPPYNKVNPSFNGFTLAQLIRISYIPEESLALSTNNSFATSAYIAMFALIMYLVTIVTNLLWTVIQLVESYDIDRDSELMEI